MVKSPLKETSSEHNGNEDLFNPLIEMKQTISKEEEEVESRNTTSPEENPKGAEFESKSSQEDPIDQEKAIREMEELFASDDETSSKDKAENCLIMATEAVIADSDENGSKSQNRKKLDSNKTISAYDLGQNGKYKLENKALTKIQLKARYQDIIYEFQSIDEVACAVCLDEEGFDGDMIIFCDLCNTAFHQTCYGSDLLTISPDDNTQWLCQRCEYLYNNDLPPTAVLCMFCPEMKGGIKQILSKNLEIWAHITCVNWIPEIYYEKEEEKEDATIEDYENKNHFGRTSLSCSFCKIKYGDPIQCDKEKCVASFHVTCAQRYGLICNWNNMKKRKRQSDTDFYLPIYCKRHMKEFDEDMLEYSNKIEQENQLRNSRISHLISIMQKVEKKPRPKKKEPVKIVEKKKTRTQSQTQEKSPPRNLRSNKVTEKTPPDKPVLASKKTRNKKSQGLKVLNQNILPPPTLMSTEDDDPEKLQTKKQDEMHIEKEVTLAENHKAGEGKKPTRELYKFRPNLARLLKYNGWGTKKEIKKAISDYVKTKSLYRKDLDELDVAKDHELEEIMGLKRIPRKNIFEEFMHFMLKKSFEEIVFDNFDDGHENYSEMNKKDSRPRNEEDDHLGPKIKRKSVAAVVFVHKEKEKQNEKNFTNINAQGEDFFNWQPKPKAQPEKRQQNLSVERILNNLENEEPNVSKKLKSDPPEKIEWAKFRTDLNWFMTPGLFIPRVSINSESLIQKLWPKGKHF